MRRQMVLTVHHLMRHNKQTLMTGTRKHLEQYEDLWGQRKESPEEERTLKKLVFSQALMKYDKNISGWNY